MKRRWESNIIVWFPFMYSQKWNCYFQNGIIMFFLSQFLHSYICERFIYFQDRSAHSAAGKFVSRSWEYISPSQTHECGNWEWGRAIPRKGRHKWDFPCSVCYYFVQYSLFLFRSGDEAHRHLCQQISWRFHILGQVQLLCNLYFTFLKVLFNLLLLFIAILS